MIRIFINIPIIANYNFFLLTKHQHFYRRKFRKLSQKFCLIDAINCVFIIKNFNNSMLYKIKEYFIRITCKNIQTEFQYRIQTFSNATQRRKYSHVTFPRWPPLTPSRDCLIAQNNHQIHNHFPKGRRFDVDHSSQHKTNLTLQRYNYILITN